MPAKLATDTPQADWTVSNQGIAQLPTPPSHPEASVARFALHVGIGGPSSRASLMKLRRSQIGSVKSSAVTAREASVLCQMPSAENANVSSGRPLFSQRPKIFGSQRWAEWILRVERRAHIAVDGVRQCALERAGPGRKTLVLPLRAAVSKAPDLKRRQRQWRPRSTRHARPLPHRHRK